MTIDINQFWTLLSESQLVNAAQTQTLFTKFSGDTSQAKEPESLAKWLVAQKAISPYQAAILAAGHSGPFRYGNYTVIERIETGSLKQHFKARHSKTGHPVLLQFFAGEKPEDLKTWQDVETMVERIAPIEHPNLSEMFDSVVLSNRRFVVSQLPSGSTLQDKLPHKGRLPWKKACAIMAQVANGLEQLHHVGQVVHNAVSPRTIWISKSGMAQIFFSPLPDHDFDAMVPDDPGSECKFDFLAPEAMDTNDESIFSDASRSRDLYSLGCTLHRMISGRVLFVESDLEKKKQLHKTKPPPSLSKYELPAELEALILKLLAKNPSERPGSATEVGNMLGLLSGKAAEISSLAIPKSKTRSAFRRSLREFLPNQGSAGIAPAIDTENEPEVVTQEVTDARMAKIRAAAESASKRKKGKWKMPTAIAAGLLGLSAIVGLFALSANKKVIKQVDKPDPVANSNNTVQPTDPVENIPGGINLADLPPKLRPILLQDLIDDDDQSLWESPTNGAPIELTFLPPAAKLVFAIRPAELVGDEEGARVLASLGPAFAKRLTEIQNQLGLTFESIDELIVSLHTNTEFEYESYFVVRANKPIDSAQMMQNWNRPVSRTLDNNQTIFDSADGISSYYVIHDDADQATNGGGDADDESEKATDSATNTVTRFAFGKKSLIEATALNLGATVLPKSIASLAQTTDRNRHINILFLRNSLFNEEGQKLMGLDNLALNRELSIMIPDNVRGGLLSLHLDAGSYFELVFERNVDLKATELKSMMMEGFRNRRDMLMNFVARIPASSYWDNVRIRYGGMLADVYRNIRWDVEHGEVVANCWLPPMAAHNLIAASEHVISFSAGTSASVAPVVSGPQTLNELLAAKRDLNIANPPDLNVLLANIQSEIKDDFRKLPFAFNIRLLGGDLEKEGITKNQRPSELVMSQKSLAEILTSIMTSANPSKDITGPSDPNCKLIWVVADDPKIPGEKAILVTTRAAAAEKSYQLPPAFLAE